MANVDESTQERETYGDASGWSQGQRADVPPAQQEPSPGSDADADSSSVEEQDLPEQQASETATPQTSQPEPEKKFNMPPPERWEELRRQREQAEQRAAHAEALARMALERAPVAPQQQAPDPWEGLVNHPDPATAQFYQRQRELYQYEARRAVESDRSSVMQAIEAGRNELAAMRIANFRKENPDIKPGSAEEEAIAGFVRQGIDLESAKKLALFDKLEAENRAYKSRKATVPQKRAAANVEAGPSIPQNSGLPQNRGSWQERVGSAVDKGAGWQDILKNAFK